MRGLLVGILLVSGGVLSLLSNATVWANRTVFNTDNFVATTNRVLDEKEVQDALATRLSDVLIEQGNVEERLREELPQNQARLAPLLTVTAHEVANNIILGLLRNDTVREGLNQALLLVHQQALRIIENKGAVVVKEDQVVLDMGVVLQKAAEELNLDPRIGQNLPEDAGQIVLVHDVKTAGAVQQLLSLHNVITWLVIGAAVGMFALAVAFSRDRRATLQATGVVVAVVGLLGALILLPLRPIVAGFTENPGVARATFDAFFLDYRIQSFLLVFLGLAVIVVAILLGDGELARALRGRVRRTSSSEVPNLGEAIRDNAATLRVSGFVGGALVLVGWPEPTTRVYVSTFALLGMYLGALWIATSSSRMASAIREQVSAALMSFRHPAPGAEGGPWAARHAGPLRLGGIALALVACFAVPDFGIGVLAVIVALTLIYLSLVDWLATRQA